jgi:hypothetical protein
MTPRSTSGASFALANQLRSDDVEAWINRHIPIPMRAGPTGCAPTSKTLIRSCSLKHTSDVSIRRLV